MERERAHLTEHAGVGVVVLGASAGGQAAILAILRDLPLDFDVPIVVIQHLPVDSSILPVYAARLPFRFQWVDESALLTPRTVLLCPPRRCIELLPDGSFRVEPCEGGAVGKQIDRLLRSVARSFSHRAIAVVLTGMGNDGAAGARELHDAGGRIVVQAESSAEFADMPRAAIANGAADLIVPLGDVAQVVLDLVAGTLRPKPRSELDAIESVFGTAGDIAGLALEIDWSLTPLGPVLQWPAELRTIVRSAIESPHVSAVWWGPELVLVYNEAYRRFLGPSKHPAALGVSARDTWREIWSDIGPRIDAVLKDGVAVSEEDFPLLIDRSGFVEEIFVNFAFAPIRDARGVILGAHNTCWETTGKVVAERRLHALRALSKRITGASAPREACERAAGVLVDHPRDVPIALLYLFDADRRQASLAGAAGLAAGSAAAPYTVALTGAHDAWALQRAIASSTSVDASGVLLEDLERRCPELATLLEPGRAGLLPRSVYVLPLRGSEDKQPVGALVAGLSPRRPFDDSYRNFIHLVAQQVNAGVVEARAGQRERERLDRFAELDRAKTDFFANVSHEFRTPLTLLLSPLEELRRRRDDLPGDVANEIDLAARNSRRLLRLVDSLLDFSQIEQRRQRASIQPTDLASLTSDVASLFRSAIERAGLMLRVDCEDKLPLVPVDREMWEKVVSNLLSNALKFTFEGEIAVRLRALSLHVELTVLDTGVGIPKHELPNIFKRFHRVRGARARTIEGSGIGLAVVHDLVSRMGGQLQVHSTEGRGTTFMIWMPLKSSRQTFEAVAAVDAGASAPRIAAGLAEEAQTWTDPQAPTLMLDESLGAPDGKRLRLAPGARVLVADDNADLRDYLHRLLGAHWSVTTVTDGAEALRAASSQRPDLILADVMMPNVDGFALLRAIRDDEALKDTPVVFLTARAGEDTAIEGLLAGADDYLVKPFSGRELIARVGGQIELSRARRRTQEVNAFLVSFSDAVRGIDDPVALASIACRMVVERLGAERAFWADADAAASELVIDAEYQVATGPALNGRFPFAAWEPLTSMYRAGTTVVIEDAPNDPRLPDAVKRALVPMRVGSALGLPVLVDGTLRGVFGVNQPAARRWTSEDIALVEGVAGRCWAEVERARGAAALRASEELQTYLLQLSDALRPLVDSAAIQDVAMQLLGRRLGVSRAQYYIADESGEYLSSSGGYTDGVDAAVGRFRLIEFGQYAYDGFHAGETQVVCDARTDPRISQTVLESYQTVGFLAFIGVPFVQRGRLLGTIAVHQSGSRQWTDTERRMVEETAVQAGIAVEQARTEAALRESEARYRDLFETMNEGYLVADVIFDESGRAVDIEYVMANPASVRMVGTDLTGKRLRDVGHYEPYWYELWGQVALTGESQHLERYAAREGIWYEFKVFKPEPANTASRRVAVVFSDVTRRRHAEEALRESEARYQALFAASPVPFLVLAADPPDYTIMAANEAYFSASLTTRESLIGRRLFDVFPDDARRSGPLGSEALRRSLERVIQTRTSDALERVRYDIEMPDGHFEPHWWMAINAPLMDAAGNVTAIIHQVTEVTELHLADDAHREHQKYSAASDGTRRKAKNCRD